MRFYLQSFALISMMSCLVATANADISAYDEDPTRFLQKNREEREARESLIPVSPFDPIRNAIGSLTKDLDEAIDLELGFAVNHLFQGVSSAVPGADKWGTTTDFDFIGSLGVINRDTPTEGKIYFGVEGRWDYNTTGPQDLGFASIASIGGTGNAFSKYTPAFILRNLYWEQGSYEAGWAYRIGKLTTDAILGTSKHISPVATFLPNAGTGLFSAGYPDSALGATGVWRANDRLRFLALVADSNGNRVDFGTPGYGDFYKAFEIGFKLWPLTERAGYSKVSVWHNDGTDDGLPINASTGREGWGWNVKLEQELTDDGRNIGILRWGSAYSNSALYDNQFGAHYLRYDPFGGASKGLTNDLLGLAVNWVEPSGPGQSEWNAEIFYRFPLFPNLHTTISYQSVWNPAFDESTDQVSVIGLRLRSTF